MQTPAQRLIAQYERLSTPPPPCPPAKSTYHRQYYSGNKPGPASSAKDRSPIRQSLRNLLSVFKKPPRKQPDTPPSSGPTPPSHPSPPAVARSGPLLYLSSTRWINCTVSLDRDFLILASPGDVDPTPHHISLLPCTDIRSLSPNQLSIDDTRLLDLLNPHGVDTANVFELIFPAQKREWFAASSLRERAAWISAIWQAILPHPTAVEVVHNQIHSQDTPVGNTSPLSVQSPIPTPLPQSSTLLDPLDPSISSRSLPPLPSTALSEIKDTKSPNLHLDLSQLKPPFSPSIYPPSTAAVSAPETTLSYFSLADKPEALHPLLRVDTSTTSVRHAGGGNSSVVISPSLYPPASSPGYVSHVHSAARSATSTSSRSSSPSVANLSQLSLVRHRLAQIERDHSQLSSQSGFTGITARVSSPLPLSPAASARSKQEAFFHDTGNKKSRPTSSVKSVDSKAPNADLCSTSQHTRIGKAAKHMKDDSGPLDPSVNDLREVSRGLNEIKSVLGGESGYPTIHQMVVNLDHRTHGEKKSLRAIQDTLESLTVRVADAIKSASTEAANNAAIAKLNGSTTSDSNEMVLKTLRGLDERVSKELNALAGKVQDVKEWQAKSEPTTELRALAPSSLVPDNKDSNPVDLQPILTKLEEIRNLCNSRPTESKEEQQNDLEDPTLSEHLEKVLKLVQEDSNKQTLLAQQQADSVRYLNELNSWLEAFVHNGTSQIQGISESVDRLCNEIGCNPGSISSGLDTNTKSPSNLVHDIRQLVTGMKARDQNFAALQAAVHGLLEVLTASQNQKQTDSHAIAGLMDRQRHDQEMLFRAFTNEISGEIKGERLRFVEAMKEATAINVQLHVEHFKRELGREVMAMTEEVGRLHREKQVVENQISDLFAFYSKHKQAEIPLQVIESNTSAPLRTMQDKPRANIPRTHQRLAPYPHQTRQN